jgi:two-component system, NtrC family, response regulator AtoC
MGRILVADDHDSLRRGIVRALSDARHEVDEAPNGNVAIEKLHECQYDVVLSDLKMGGSDGMDVLRTAKSLQPNTAVILMTAFGTVHTAVEAMKIGAFDYVQKPFEIEEMELKVNRAIDDRRLRHEIEYLRHTQQDIYDFDRIVGASGALQSVLSIVKKVAKSNTTVLIRGETGTGKELIAGAIHHNSLRCGRNFVKVNCAALQENLLESELFGHEKGAFTGADKQRVGRFEQADGGTLFLDEVGDMSPNTQAKILRVLQEHEFERLGGTRTLRVDVRVITATNRNLPQMVAQGLFREDLYYRLNVVSIDMPPLRERKEDIDQLAKFFLKRFAGELKKRVDGLSPDAHKLLMRYNWPGNIRELENAIERAVVLSRGNTIMPEHLPLAESPVSAGGRARSRKADAKAAASKNGEPDEVEVAAGGTNGTGDGAVNGEHANGSFKEAVESLERKLIAEALDRNGGNRSKAAEELGIYRRLLYAKMREYGLGE